MFTRLNDHSHPVHERDTVYVGMDGRKGNISKNDTYFGNSSFEYDQMYNFLKMHKEVAYNSDIPHSSCLCEVCENALLLAKGIN